MTLAFNSRHPYVDKRSRWIASLSDGTTVFEDRTPGEPSAWKRLGEYIKTNELKITNLRLEVFGRFVKLVSYKDDTGRVQLDGYWQSSKMAAFFGGAEGELRWRGIGFVKKDEVQIVWVDHNGVISQETRKYTPEDPAVILNDV